MITVQRDNEIHKFKKNIKYDYRGVLRWRWGLRRIMNTEH